MQSSISDLLQRLIKEGHFGSRMELFLQESRMTTWYTETSQRESKEIAEERLARAAKFRSAFANSLAPTAWAFAALAQDRPELVYNISECDVKTQSQIDPRYGMSYKFVAFNPDMQDGSSLGGLPLRAVVLEVGQCFEHPSSTSRTVATLVFSRPTLGDTRFRSVGDGLAFVQYDQTGPNVFHMERYPYVESQADKRPFTDTKAFLGFMLGMDACPSTLNTTGQDGGIADVLGGIRDREADSPRERPAASPWISRTAALVFVMIERARFPGICRGSGSTKDIDLAVVFICLDSAVVAWMLRAHTAS